MSLQPLYLDDLKIGQKFKSGEHTMETEDIKRFAAEFDPQPFHLDEVAASNSFFSALAASGWHTASATMKMLVESVNIAGGVIGAGADIAWPRPTRPGDVLHTVSEITEIKPSRSKPGRGMITVKCQTFNQHDEVVQNMTTRILVTRQTKQ